MCVCVCVWGGDEVISKLKGAGGNACPPTLILACVHSTLRLVPHKSFVQHIGEAAQK